MKEVFAFITAMSGLNNIKNPTPQVEELQRWGQNIVEDPIIWSLIQGAIDKNLVFMQDGKLEITKKGWTSLFGQPNTKTITKVVKEYPNPRTMPHEDLLAGTENLIKEICYRKEHFPAFTQAMTTERLQSLNGQLDCLDATMQELNAPFTSEIAKQFTQVVEMDKV